jgi:hypothetical protein
MDCSTRKGEKVKWVRKEIRIKILNKKRGKTKDKKNLKKKQYNNRKYGQFSKSSFSIQFRYVCVGTGGWWEVS